MDHSTTVTQAGCGYLATCTCHWETWTAGSKAIAQRRAADHQAGR